VADEGGKSLGLSLVRVGMYNLPDLLAGVGIAFEPIHGTSSTIWIVIIDRIDPNPLMKPVVNRTFYNISAPYLIVLKCKKSFQKEG
jgi:hypothetical protein